MTNTSNLPAEALEIEYPLTLLRYELVDGSGGAGEYRGGMGLRRVYRAERDCLVKLDGSRLRSQPWGLSGGGPGGLGSYAYSGDSANFDHGNGKLSKGDTVTIITPGAGGYGDPSKRSGAASAADRAQHCL
jgi:N-methylhydantoinase B